MTTQINSGIKTHTKFRSGSRTYVRIAHQNSPPGVRFRTASRHKSIARQQHGPFGSNKLRLLERTSLRCIFTLRMVSQTDRSISTLGYQFHIRLPAPTAIRSASGAGVGVRM